MYLIITIPEPPEPPLAVGLLGNAGVFEPPPPPKLVRGPLPPKRPPRIQPQGMNMGGNINKGISMLPMNGQGDTLTTQVFQSGFRPRR